MILIPDTTISSSSVAATRRSSKCGYMVKIASSLSVKYKGDDDGPVTTSRKTTTHHRHRLPYARGISFDFISMSPHPLSLPFSPLLI
jgi:hypothetical protein